MYANIFIKKEFEYTMKYDIQKLSAKGIEFFTISNFESKIKSRSFIIFLKAYLDRKSY